jgi:hypothetical protein
MKPARSAAMTALVMCVISAAGAAQDTLGADSAGRAAAGVVLGGKLTDDEVRELLRQYSVLPYAAYLAGPMGDRFRGRSRAQTLSLIELSMPSSLLP